MSEPPPPGVPQDAADHPAQALTAAAPDSQVTAVLADFQNWLTSLALPSTETPPADCEPSSAPTVDLHTLLGQFLAVRQEVNLQTRAVRAQQEQNTETLRQLAHALEMLQETQGEADLLHKQAEGEALRPLLKTLIDTYDALALGSREMQRMQETVQAALGQLATGLQPPPPAEPEPTAAPRLPPPSGSFWKRWFESGNKGEEQAAQQQREQETQQRQRLLQETSDRVRQMLASLVTGYTMSLQRVERALHQHGLEAIPAVGERFDPEQMEVVEAVTDSGRPAGEVIEEVRRGYRWNGRVFRYAQVRVAKY
jgi:molecular chaperone GrpE